MLIEDSKKYFSDWNNRSEIHLNKIKQFLYRLSNQEKEAIFEQVSSIHGMVFSKIDCLQCANCCRTTPPIFTNKDIKRIAQFLGTTPKQFKRKYTIEDVNGELIGIKVPCSFLNDDNTCSIYDVRPLACRTYPHTDDSDYALRPELNYQNTIVCPAAYAISQKLMNQKRD